MATKQLTTETDIVASVNEKGLRLRGHDAWLNFSKFPDKQVPHPMQGETVTVTYDTARWIEALVIGERAPATIAACDPPDALDLLAGDLQSAPAQGARFQPDVSLPEERAIYLETRRAALQAACSCLAGRDQAASEMVLQVADRFAEWLLAYPSV